MKMPANKTISETAMKPITVSNANATWENASNKINYYETFTQKEKESIQTQAIKENYSFVTEWSIHSNESVKHGYEYKAKDEFIVDW